MKLLFGFDPKVLSTTVKIVICFNLILLLNSLCDKWTIGDGFFNYIFLTLLVIRAVILNKYFFNPINLMPHSTFSLFH